MNEHLNIHYSNRVEALYTQLKGTLFVNSPFKKRLIIVPSPAMKSWLTLQMAKDAELGISMGIEISYLDQTIQGLIPHINNLNRLELTFLIEKEIREFFIKEPFMTDQEKGSWQPLFNYLGMNPATSSSRKCERRLSALSNALASLFMQYGLYGGTMLDAFKQAVGWQERLWCKIFENKNTFYKALKTIINDPSFKLSPHIEIHIFSLSFIPKLFFEFLMKVSKFTPVNIFLLSPCQLYWEDVLSDRESQKLTSYFRKKGVSNQQQTALEELLRDRNPLLANFGRIGREMANQLEICNGSSSEIYLLPDSLRVHEIYESQITDETFFYKTENPLTLLQAVQSDLVLLRNPESAEKVILARQDNTIQIHAASNRMREIEILYNTLLGIIDTHSKDPKPIEPGDIIVMAPDISEYIPYIKAVFNSSESLLKAQTMDAAAPQQNLYIQGFLLLISLSESRWDITTLFQLLEHPDFQRRHSLCSEDVTVLREWMKESEMRWGINSFQRNELLKKNACKHGMIDNTAQGTLEHSIDQLLFGLIMNTEYDRTAPLLIDALQGELLGRWIELLHSLHTDLACLEDQSTMTLQEWVLYLQSLCEAYLLGDDPILKDDLYTHFEALFKAGNTTKEVLFSFNTIKYHLNGLLEQEIQNYRERSLNSIRFCSLLPMRAIPAEVIVMIGMDEESYPRNISNSSLNLMRAATNADYCPAQIDYDRFLFLETLLSARRYLLFSYQGSSSDGIEQAPSLLIRELLNYLDKAFVIEGKTPSQCCIYRHPYYSFDKEYFMRESRCRNYIKQHFRAAQAYYHPEKQTPVGFLSKTYQSASPKIHSPILQIDIAELDAFARNPVKTYFNKTLGIYLENAEKRLTKNDEDFYLTTLQSYILRKNALTEPFEKILSIASREGCLPVGAFKPVAIEKLQNDIFLLKNNLKNFGIHSEHIFSVSCSDQVLNPSQSAANQLQLPILKIPLGNTEVHISGSIPEVSPQGLIAHAHDSIIDIVKIWPRFLILNCLIQTHQLPIEPHLITIKGTGKKKLSFIENPECLLREYIHYYLFSLGNVSLLIPELVPPLLISNSQGFSELMRTTLTNPFKPLYNEYLKWALQDFTIIPESKDFLNQWQPIAQNLFSDLSKNWYQKTNK